MRLIAVFILTLLGLSSARATEPGFTLDSNTAFYEGEQYEFVMPSPPGYRMVGYKAKFDGYSFAFVPEEELYDSADVIIGAHIYKIRGLSFEQALKSDTSAINQHYGSAASLRALDPIKLETGGQALTFYFDAHDSFIPNVMIAYIATETELVVYELVITEDAHKVAAEDQFVQAVRSIKALKRAELGQK